VVGGEKRSRTGAKTVILAGGLITGLGGGQMATPLSMFDIVEAFQKQKGCPVCLLIRRKVEQFIHAMLFEHIIRPHMHDAFRAGRGLCNTHAWQMSRFNGALLNIAVYYRGTINQLLTSLDEPGAAMPIRFGLGRLVGKGGPSSSVADRLEPTGSCVVCEARAEIQELHTRTIGQHISDSRLSDAYRQSLYGLCLPHFRLALRYTQTAADQRILVDIQRTLWEALMAELDEFKEMHDHRHTGEWMGMEGDSWLRALKAMAGEEGIFGIDPTADEI